MKLIRSCTFAAILNTTNRISASTLRYSTTNKFSSRMLSISRVKVEDISFISADIAKLIDEDLMFKQGSYSIDQLMELAGLSVASAAHDYFCRTISGSTANNGSRNILILAGPGNNGGDGLVSARHLKHFGYQPTIVYPKQSQGLIFSNLVKQCNELGIPIYNDLLAANSLINSCSNRNNTKEIRDKLLPLLAEKEQKDQTQTAELKFSDNYDLIIDSLFGFSFKGQPREPFSSIIQAMAVTAVPVLAVDIPSGWDIEQGDIYNTGFSPSAVISLTAPKICMKGYKGYHYIGGRFVPPTVIEKYNIKIANYGYNTNQIVLAYFENEKEEKEEEENEYYKNDKMIHNIENYVRKENKKEENVNEEKDGNENGNEKKIGIIESFYNYQKSNQKSDENESNKISDEKLTVIFVTASSVKEAKKLSKVLLEGNTIACVNLIPQVTSLYMWNGKLEEQQEVIMMIKTKTSKINEVTSIVKTTHSYDLPETIALNIDGGSEQYLNWVRKSSS